MSRDTLFERNYTGREPFEFNEDVADVFSDMLKRSVPGYAASIQAIGSLAARYVQPNTRCYDLGCSLGAATLAMSRNITADGCRVIAVDNAPAMVSRCRQLMDDEKGRAEISVLEADIEAVEIAKASMVVMNYTLQFLPVDARQPMIKRIADGMIDGGILVLSEKVVDDDVEVESALVRLHHEFKQRNAYSDLEISRKRAALEDVLIPETVAAHRQRLADAGFHHIGIWLRYFNFISMIAIR